MKVHLGVLFICIINKFNQAKGSDIEQFSSTMLQKYDIRTLTNTSTTNLEQFRMRSRRHVGGGTCGRCGVANIEKEIRTAIVNGDDVLPTYKYPWTMAAPNKSSPGSKACETLTAHKSVITLRIIHAYDNITHECISIFRHQHDVFLTGERVCSDLISHNQYKVAIRTFGEISCTGSIINEYFILTASHCFKKELNKYTPFKHRKTRVPYILPSQVSVDIGKTSRQPVKRIIPHANFDISEWRNDIALLQMKNRIVCNRFTSTICIPPPNFALPKRATLIIAGFGSDKTGKETTIDHLKEAKVHQVSYNECHFPSHMKDGTYYCLKGLNYTKKKRQTACFGDSGGPMMYEHENKFYQLGVASFGKECDISEAFLDTSVPAHLDWIYKSMRNCYGKGLSGKGAQGTTTDKGAQETTTDKGAQETTTDKGAQEKATCKGLSAAGGSEHSRKAGGCGRGKKRTRRTEGQEGHEFAQGVKEEVGGYRATGLSSSRDRRHLEAIKFAEGGYASKASPEAGGSGRVKRGNSPSL